MVFLADDLAVWLVGLVADAGRKKLTTWVLGTDQERALSRAATAAIQATVIQLAPSGGQQAEQLAMVISEVFREPKPDAVLAGQGEGLFCRAAGTIGAPRGLGRRKHPRRARPGQEPPLVPPQERLIRPGTRPADSTTPLAGWEPP